MKRFVVLVILVAALGGCDLAWYPSTDPAAPTVLAVGDSNLTIAGPSLPAAFAPGWSVASHGFPGKTATASDWPATITADLAAYPAAAVIVQLGTNDAWFCSLDPKLAATWPAAVDAIVGAVPSGMPVVWNTVKSTRGTFWVKVCASVFNLSLHEAATRWANLKLADFDGHFSGHNEWFDPWNDYIHLNAAGAAEYATFERAQLP